MGAIWTPIILLLVGLKGFQSFQPTIHPNTQELILDEGQPLEIECVNLEKINFFYPNDDEPYNPTSPFHLSQQNLSSQNLYKFTFTKPNTIYGDTGLYTCNTEKPNGNYSFVKSIYVFVKSKNHLLLGNKEEILQINARIGETVTIPCRATDPTYDVRLKVLNMVERVPRTTEKYNPRLGFVMKNVKVNDTHLYQCYVYHNGIFDNVTYNVTVRDIKYIKLTPHLVSNSSESITGGKVNWIVGIDEYPEEFFIFWTTPYEKVIKSGSKYVLHEDNKWTNLTINELNIHDSGEYQLFVRNSFDEQELKFSLAVKSAPLKVNIESSEGKDDFYLPNKSVTFTCEAYAYPKPKFEWSFYPYLSSNFDQLDYNSVKYFEASEVIQGKKSSFHFLSTVTMQAIKNGKIICQVCNFKCYRNTRDVSVSEIPGAFAILHPASKIAIGQGFNLTCVSAIRNEEKLEWLLDSNNAHIVSDDRTRIIEEKDNFTTYSTLVFLRAQKSDSKKYICKGIKRTEYDLFIYEPKPLHIIQTNMNSSDMIFDSDVKVVTNLTCFIEGIPEPNITWYKDDQQLTESKQFHFEDDKQTLQIKFLIDQDSGVYKCTGKNDFETVEETLRITVNEKLLTTAFIAVLVVMFIIVFLCLVIVILKFRKNQAPKKKPMEDHLIPFEDEVSQLADPELSPEEQLRLLPYDMKFEFPRGQLELGEQIGEGQFGIVLKAKANGICKGGDVTTVAVKTLEESVDLVYLRALANELKIMISLGKHLNIVSLLGACTGNIAKRELLVIVEYCQFGNLRNHLLRLQSSFINQIDVRADSFNFSIGNDLVEHARSKSRFQSKTESPFVQIDDAENLVCSHDLLFWAFQVARGMEYLTQKKVVHGDLAARNILLAEDNIIKICDFGLAKAIYQNLNYRKSGKGVVPFRWMAIESIRNQIFTTKSDVWSFGIVLWEFFSLATEPYWDMDAHVQYIKLVEGYRLPKPKYATKKLHDIMLRCWSELPSMRPTFTELAVVFGRFIQKSSLMHYIEVNKKFQLMKKFTCQDGKTI